MQSHQGSDFHALSEEGTIQNGIKPTDGSRASEQKCPVSAHDAPGKNKGRLKYSSAKYPYQECYCYKMPYCGLLNSYARDTCNNYTCMTRDKVCKNYAPIGTRNTNISSMERFSEEFSPYNTGT